MSLDVVVSAGASGPVASMVITEKNQADLTDCTFETALITSGETPVDGDFDDASSALSQGPGSEVPNVATVLINVDAEVATAGVDYRQWVRLTDGNRIYVLPSPDIIHAT